MITKNLSGIEKAAVFIMNLERNDAASILKHLDFKQIQKLGLAMSSIKNIDKEVMDSVIKDFVNTFEEQTIVSINNHEYIKDVITDALGEEKAGRVLDKIASGGNLSGLNTLKWLESKNIADLIKFEHPQIQTVVLSYIGGQKASKVLEYFDEEVRIDLMMRVANLKSINPQALEELNQILENRKENYVEKKVEGLETAAGIINHLEPPIEAKIMNGIKNYNSQLGEKIEDKMFVFEDFNRIENLSMQRLLRQISSKQLLLALKGASSKTKDKVYSNMSKRAALLLKDDLEAMPPVRIKEVENAQKQIIKIAKQLAANGEISLDNKNAREMI